MQNNYLKKVFFLIAAAAAWEFIPSAAGISVHILPPLSSVLSAGTKALLNGELFLHTGFSVYAITAGSLAGIALALFLSFCAFMVPACRTFISSLNTIFHPLPGIALLPLIILFAGTGLTSIIIIIIHSVCWPVYNNLEAGFSSVPRIFLDLSLNYELKRLKHFFHILLPASFTHLTAGLKTAWARAWRALISAEMIFGAAGGIGGLGWWIFKKRMFMDTAGIYAGLLVIILLGILVEKVFFSWLENRTINRQPAGEYNQ
jgi:NitT/TauT family transport system permease protein